MDYITRNLEKQEEQKRQMLLRIKILSEYPEIARFMQKKRKWMYFLVLYSFINNLVSIINFNQSRGISFAILIPVILIRLLITYSYLWFSMQTKWDNTVFLYIRAVIGAMSFYRGIEKVGSLEQIIWVYRQAFVMMPSIILADALTCISIFLSFSTGLWLRHGSKNKALAIQFDELMQNGGKEKVKKTISEMAKWTNNDGEE